MKNLDNTQKAFALALAIFVVYLIASRALDWAGVTDPILKKYIKFGLGAFFVLFIFIIYWKNRRRGKDQDRS